MTDDTSETEELLRRAKAGDGGALAQLLLCYRLRLRQMIRLRLDRRLHGRIDPSDVLQETFLDLARRFPEYAEQATIPFFLWLRGLAGQRLIDVHRIRLRPRSRRAAGRRVYRALLLGIPVATGAARPTIGCAGLDPGKLASA
ncbi:MAG TPA: hypothetical protein VFA18_06470 [Gemmataceae bacterium]|nr:hypothetical protein [Gemmataceae bacterium]